MPPFIQLAEVCCYLGKYHSLDVTFEPRAPSKHPLLQTTAGALCWTISRPFPSPGAGMETVFFYTRSVISLEVLNMDLITDAEAQLRKMSSSDCFLRFLRNRNFSRKFPQTCAMWLVQLTQAHSCTANVQVRPRVMLAGGTHTPPPQVSDSTCQRTHQR